MEGWPRAWQARYPPLHYLILGTAYKPVLQHWERTGQRSVDPSTGRWTLTSPQAPKVGLLILIARGLSVVMAVGTGLGLWAATRRLTQDDLAAILAAGALLTGAAFTYFAHLGNVDIPSMCWLSWSLYFYVRALQSQAWKDCVLLGLFAALAACTKDAVGAVYPGMALVLLVAQMRRRRSSWSWFRVVFSGLWQPRWLWGCAAFAVPYLLINGVLVDPAGFAARMKYWITPAADSVLASEYRYPDQLRLLLAALHHAAGGVGWPMLAAMIVSVGWAIRKRSELAWVVLAPAVGYYVLVIAQINFVYARFLFPVIILVCMTVGAAGAALWRRETWALEIRCGILCLALLPSLAYAAAVDAEMELDSRYAAEAWFADNVELSASVGAFSKPQYLPRLSDLGWTTFSVEMARESFARPQPEHLILTNYNYEAFDSDRKECMQDLLAGRLGYTRAVAFQGRFLGTGSSWLSVAGWGAPVPGKISPTLTVLRRGAR